MYYDQSRLCCCLGLPSTDLWLSWNCFYWILSKFLRKHSRHLTECEVNYCWWLGLKSLTQQSGLSQLVKTPTRNDSILDVFLTNTPNIFGKVCTSKSVTKSDHSSLFIFPRVWNPSVRSAVEFIDARNHHKSLTLQKLQATDFFIIAHKNTQKRKKIHRINKVKKRKKSKFTHLHGNTYKY